ncbi:MAG: AAA family ATPase, partial [Dongiaceae bacterium]
MVQFTKLRLSGFKSFVDSTELLIESGLTGIVGPNGCGKSNLVEALRWAMGETSAKSMRGGEMDDVIFGGSTTRPARNIAEVVLMLDNQGRRVPALFNDNDELEISRRIERGSGSTYRVNGSEVRARDVQLLFADAATGAHSTALVSQGRVGAIINAKPVDRRALLEEAAGITGLHSRRHEAELRLRAAEANLSRLDDVIVTLEGQLQALKKQARQAARYRNLNDHIRRVEATLLHLLWREATARLAAAETALGEAEGNVAELTGKAAHAASRQGTIAAELPALRHHEAAAAAELQRLNLARDGLDQEEARVAAAQAEAAR